MQNIEFELLTFGLQFISLVFLLYPSIKFAKDRSIQYQQLHSDINLLIESESTGNLVQNKTKQNMGFIQINPIKGSTMKAFKSTYYSDQNNLSKSTLRNASGSYFYGNIINRLKIAKHLPQSVRIDLKRFDLHKSTFREQRTILNPKNVWSDMVDQITKSGQTSHNKYSLNKINITIKIAPLALFGEIKIDQFKNMTQIVPKCIASNYLEMLQYFKQRKLSSLLNMIGGIFVSGCVITLGYYLFKDKLKKIAHLFRSLMKYRNISSNVFSDPSDRLHCKRCLSNPSNIILQCSHLSTCQQCYLKDKRCPQCNVLSETFVKIYL